MLLRQSYQTFERNTYSKIMTHKSFECSTVSSILQDSTERSSHSRVTLIGHQYAAHEMPQSPPKGFGEQSAWRYEELPMKHDDSCKAGLALLCILDLINWLPRFVYVARLPAANDDISIDQGSYHQLALASPNSHTSSIFRSNVLL